MVGLSIPYESKIDQSHLYKVNKYEELDKEGYSVIMKAVEIAARGFCTSF